MLRYIFTLLFVVTISAQQPGDFVDIQKINPHIRLDIRYATANNFLHRAVYPQARCFLRYETALALSEVQKELESIGLGLKVFDGYRPLSVQKMMWKIMPDNRYVANPAKGSRHNRGAAVDVTLVDSSGQALKMPTPFDDFSKRAHHDYDKLPVQVRINRWILKTIMEKHGFTPISTEWWHYDLKGWQKYPVEDYSFDELDNSVRRRSNE